jgi:hypothetical protein
MEEKMMPEAQELTAEMSDLLDDAVRLLVEDQDSPEGLERLAAYAMDMSLEDFRAWNLARQEGSEAGD